MKLPAILLLALLSFSACGSDQSEVYKPQQLPPINLRPIQEDSIATDEQNINESLDTDQQLHELEYSSDSFTIETTEEIPLSETISKYGNGITTNEVNIEKAARYCVIGSPKHPEESWEDLQDELIELLQNDLTDTSINRIAEICIANDFINVELKETTNNQFIIIELEPNTLIRKFAILGKNSANSQILMSTIQINQDIEDSQFEELINNLK